MQLDFGNNLTTVSGTIGILGTGAIFHSNTPYMAVLTGTFLGSVIGAAPIAPELTADQLLNARLLHMLLYRDALNLFGVS